MRILVSMLAGLVFTLSACVSDNVSVSPLTPDHLAFNPFDTAASRPDILLTGKLAGRLTSNGRCVIVEARAGPVTPLWPEGTELLRQGGRLLLRLPDGRGTAQVGKRVQLGGGTFPEASHGRLSERVRNACPRSFFAVSNANE